MAKSEHPSVKSLTGEMFQCLRRRFRQFGRNAPPRGINRITNQGVSDMGKMDPNLMRAPGL